MGVDIEILKQQNKLVTNNGKIYVKPIDQYNFVAFPIEDLKGSLALSVEEYLGLRAMYYRFNENLDGLEINETIQDN